MALMTSQNVTLKVNSELYDAFRSYCKKNDLLVSRQFEIMMEEKIGPEYKKNTSTKLFKSNENEKTYVGSLTGEPFMIHETKIVASLLLKNNSIDFIKKAAVQENLFGYRTIKSIPKRVNAIIKRISQLEPMLLNKLVNDLSGDGKVVVLYSIYLRDKLFYEFLNEVIAEKFLIRDFDFDKRMIQKFISDKSDSDRKIREFTKETKTKLVSVIFNILKEVGLISETEKSYKLNNLLISSELRNYFENKGEKKFLKSLGVSS